MKFERGAMSADGRFRVRRHHGDSILITGKRVKKNQLSNAIFEGFGASSNHCAQPLFCSFFPSLSQKALQTNPVYRQKTWKINRDVILARLFGLSV